MNHRIFAIIFLMVGILSPLTAQHIQSPEEVFGFKMGADRRLVNWEQIVSYFTMLDKSPRVQVEELGKTTLGRPMIMAIISSEETLRSLETYRKIQEQLARPFTLSERRARRLTHDGKIVVLLTMNIHSSEIAASQESLELAYQLATADDDKTRSILNNVILLMVPSLNPDGQDMITKWYLSTVGTPYEGSPMPYKYHHYADHDNNRDWHFFNLKETRNVAKVLYREWYPEIVMDQHQMGSAGARFFLPPYADPVNPNVAPTITADINLVGNYIVSRMHERGLKGVVTGTIFNAYFEGTMSKTPLWHNRIGILTEAASVRYATPLYFPKSSLHGMGIDLPSYSQQTNFLDPWPGGWWRLRDIVEYQKTAALALLEIASNYKERFMLNFFRLNKRAIEVGRQDHPQAYVIPLNQHDPSNAVELLRRLRIANVDIYTATADFDTPQGRFHRGDFVVPLQQPARAYIKDVMERQHYPNLKEYPDGPPRQPYDVTAWTFPLQMGVKAVALEEPLSVPLTPTEPRLAMDTSAITPGWLAIERRYTGSFRLVNTLLKEKIDVYELTGWDDGYPPGTFAVWCSKEQLSAYREKSTAFEVPMHPFKRQEQYVQLAARKLRPARIGIYQPWIPRAYDEGWLRFVLDEFGFDYTILHNVDIQGKANLAKEFDVLIFGSQGSSWIMEGKPEKPREKKLGEPEIKKEFRGGVGARGVEHLKDFMMKGGTVLFFGDACNFAMEKLHLPANNPLKKADRKSFFIPGSILRMTLDGSDPLTYGMPAEIPVYFNNNVVLQLQPYPSEISEIGFFDDHDLLMSGWAVGTEKLFGKVALARIPVGKGSAILYAFRPQHRGQTYGTVKLIFNALYLY